MTAPRRLVPMDEIKTLADFLATSGFSYNSVSVSKDTVTFARLPESSAPIMVPSHGGKKRNAFEEFYNLPASD